MDRLDESQRQRSPMKILTKDDTDYDVDYVTRADAESEIEAWAEKAKSIMKDYLREGREKDQEITRLKLLIENEIHSLKCACGDDSTGWVEIKCCNICGLTHKDETLPWVFFSANVQELEPPKTLPLGVERMSEAQCSSPSAPSGAILH
jgi:hypothetical protein